MRVPHGGLAGFPAQEAMWDSGWDSGGDSGCVAVSSYQLSVPGVPHEGRPFATTRFVASAEIRCCDQGK